MREFRRGHALIKIQNSHTIIMVGIKNLINNFCCFGYFVIKKYKLKIFDASLYLFSYIQIKYYSNFILIKFYEVKKNILNTI